MDGKIGKPMSQPNDNKLDSTRFQQWSSLSIQLLSLPLILFLVIPILILLTSIAPAQFIQNISQPQVLTALAISFKTTTISLLLTILTGTPLAYLMAKVKFPFKRALDALIDLPTVLPPLVAGVALLMTFGRLSPVGSLLNKLGISIAFTQTAVVMAQLFISAPFYIRAATLGFSAIDPELEQACQLDGANRWQAFRYVILPLSRSALISGGVMSWARALGEFGATIIFAGNFPGRTQTMPLAIYLGFEINFNNALTLSVILVSLSFISLFIIKFLINKPTLMG
jgi:molybdate transport system permease protein